MISDELKNHFPAKIYKHFYFLMNQIYNKNKKLSEISKSFECRPTGIRTPTNRTKIWCATVTPWVFRFKWCKYTDFIINYKIIFLFFLKLITSY